MHKCRKFTGVEASDRNWRLLGSEELLYDRTHGVYEFGAIASYGYGATGLVQRSMKFANTSIYIAYAFDPMGNAVSRYVSTDAAVTPQDLAFYNAF